MGAQLLMRRARGIELTPSGRAFLDHARAVLSQVEAAAEAARRAARPAKPCFSMGFLTGHELTWMPEALRILHSELPNIDVMISESILAAAGLDGRPGERKNRCGVSAAGKRNARVGLPSTRQGTSYGDPAEESPPRRAQGHQPKGSRGRGIRDRVEHGAKLLRLVIDNFLKRSGADIKPAHEADHITMGMSLIASTGGVGLLPAYAQNFLPPSVTSRPLTGDTPTVDLVFGYTGSRTNLPS